jgi:hypothetical protein
MILMKIKTEIYIDSNNICDEKNDEKDEDQRKIKYKKCKITKQNYILQN